MTHSNRTSSLSPYPFIVAAFCALVVISNVISVKFVKLPWFHDLSIPAGLFTYPMTFLLSNLVSEVFGTRKAKFMIYIALAINMLGFGIIQLTLLLPTSLQEQEMLGLSGLRILSSLIAYMTAQIVDIQLYGLIRKWTGPRFLWLRNNGATCISQVVDTFVIDILFLYCGLNMPITDVLSIMLFSCSYKALFSIVSTPVLYLFVYYFSRVRKDALQ